MDRVEVRALNRSPLINRFTNDVHDTTESAGTHRDGDRALGIKDVLSSNESIGGI